MISGSAVAWDAESAFNRFEIRKRLFIGGVYEVATDQDQIRFEGIDLFDGLFEARNVGFVAAKAKLRIAHLNEGKRLESSMRATCQQRCSEGDRQGAQKGFLHRMPRCNRSDGKIQVP